MEQVFTAPLDTDERSGENLWLPVTAGAHLYPGTLLALITSTGFVTFAQDVAGLIVLGRAESDVDNTADGVGGALSINVKRGVFAFAPSSRAAGIYAPTAENVGQLVYVENEGVVQIAAGSAHKIVAGLFLGIDPDSGAAWVDTQVGTGAGSAEAFIQSQNALAGNAGGVAAAPVAGTRTIATIVAGDAANNADLQTTQNAIADLAAELILVKADIATLKLLV